MTNLNRVYIIGMSTIIFLFTVFLIIRYEKITIGKNKLNENYMNIYEDNKIKVYTKFLDLTFKNKTDSEYSLSEALNKNIITFNSIINQSSRKEEKENMIVYYFDKNSKMRSNKNFQIVICKKEEKDKSYIVDNIDINSNICNEN